MATIVITLWTSSSVSSNFFLSLLKGLLYHYSIDVYCLYKSADRCSLHFSLPPNPQTFHFTTFVHLRLHFQLSLSLLALFELYLYYSSLMQAIELKYLWQLIKTSKAHKSTKRVCNLSI